MNITELKTMQNWILFDGMASIQFHLLELHAIIQQVFFHIPFYSNKLQLVEFNPFLYKVMIPTAHYILPLFILMNLIEFQSI